MFLPPLRIGLDEAGRGCVIGPLVVGCVAATDTDRIWFSRNHVRDSKLVPPDERAWLSKKIRARCWFQTSHASPNQIDEAVRDRSRTLNGLERERMSLLLQSVLQEHPNNSLHVMIDAPSINPTAFIRDLKTHFSWPEHFMLQAEHRADVRYLVVAAASIIAKQEREDAIEKLKKDLGEDFGCGYPHDQKTKLHLIHSPKNANHIRWTWSTVKDKLDLS
ncbi:ribonuclease HII [Candidatus Uhrbacteria bacterium]|nr:ribonuclease HII [Candidatus Uhrbacteria bacterium]